MLRYRQQANADINRHSYIPLFLLVEITTVYVLKI